MARKEKIDKTLQYLKNILLKKIATTYSESLQKKSISDELEFDIQHFLQDIHLCLNLCAHEISEKALEQSNSTNVYFPIENNLDTFRQLMNNFFPKLNNSVPDLYDYLTGIQKNLLLTNLAILLEDNSLKPKLIKPVTNTTLFKIINNTQNTDDSKKENLDWCDLLFNRTNESALTFLDKLLGYVEKIINEIYERINFADTNDNSKKSWQHFL